MPFFGITVVIISKFCEVMKSETKIVLINYNTHVHTLIKKKLFFDFHHFWRKQRGGRSPSAQKMTFFGLTEISDRWGCRRLQNLAG